MAMIRFTKVVSNLPGTLTPDTMYLVRTGVGFDLYASDTTGSIAYLVNASNAPIQIAYPKRTATPKIVGDVSGTGLSTVALTASRLHFIPLVVPRSVTLTGLRISVTTAGTGTASIGIYSNTVVSGDDTPGTLLASVTGLDTGTTGDKTGSLSYTLQVGTLYWVCLIASGAPTIRGLAVASRGVDLGRVSNSTAAVSYLYASGSGSTLPSSISTPPSVASNQVTPSIYLLE
jgi:hypothetical protein